MDCPLDPERIARFGHVEDVLKRIYFRSGKLYGNEGHTLTNSRFGDLFDILYEDMEEAVQRINELRAIGVKVAIAEVGDEFCPVFRLTTTAFDYAFLDRYAANSLLGDGAERIAGSLVNFLHYLKVKVVAPQLDGEEQIAAAEAVGCDGYTIGAEPMTEGVKADA
jgi:predicted signal transduction protein with EAL and GGDEF domain